MFSRRLSHFIEEELKLAVSADDYMDKLVEYSMMKLCAICTVKETRQTWAQEDDFQVLKPTLDIEVMKYYIVQSDPIFEL